ncbi:hypothetical protein SDC9_187578 [bioreactor metagenome]|uniref:Uncharacterized protein n=1 Tax=bioreactor metagenome TaxID=1076179 RepID=A0A645HXJ5_9ZZZZ
MVIAGALSGVAGGLIYLSGAGKYISVVDVLSPEGFNGIPVALLGLSNPIGIFFAALFISNITVGGFFLQRYNFVPEVINIITAAIIYFSAFSLAFKYFIDRLILKKSKTEDAVGTDTVTSEPENKETDVENPQGGDDL